MTTELIRQIAGVCPHPALGRIRSWQKQELPQRERPVVTSLTRFSTLHRSCVSWTAGPDGFHVVLARAVECWVMSQSRPRKVSDYREDYA
jgi:hypothetical protein